MKKRYLQRMQKRRDAYTVFVGKEATWKTQTEVGE
jgi:hypothetical protein